MENSQAEHNSEDSKVILPLMYLDEHHNDIKARI